jgi:hypothetical protein
MKLVTPHFGKIAIAATVATSAMGWTFVSPAAAQGLFDFLFRPHSDSARSYAPPNAPFDFNGPGSGPRISGGTGRWASYCVRLCDGRYFPIQRTSAQPGDICSSMCPASKTRIFTGSDIANASASDGTRYENLENAFVYREKTVEGCTCNGATAYGLVPMNVRDDPTLRPGDLIATADGLEKFTGATKSARAPVSEAAAESSEIRDNLPQEEPRPRRRAHRSFSFFNLFR